MQRCAWVTAEAIYQHYHDQEWGVPLHDERRLFEGLLLEGMQAGLSWISVLRRREAYRELLHDFDAQQMARYDAAKQAQLLADARIIRHRAKVAALVSNAQAYLRLCEQRGSLEAYLWDWVDGTPKQNAWECLAQVPASTPLAEQLSRDLKRRGFSFVGPTICYAFMQAVGMVNDHTVECFRHAELALASARG